MKTWQEAPSLSGQKLLCILDWENGCYAAFSEAFTFIFTSQLLRFNYFNHLVHSTVSSLFHLKYIRSHALWTCFSILSYFCLFASINFSYTWLSYQQQAHFMTPEAFVMIYHKTDFLYIASIIYNYRLPGISLM